MHLSHLHERVFIYVSLWSIRSYHLHVSSVPSQPSAPDCGSNPGWRKNNDVCYYYNDTDIVDFHTARRRCYDEKASLVSILSKEEQAYVNSMVRLSFVFFYCVTVEHVVMCRSDVCCCPAVLLLQVGTGQVAAAWIGMRMSGIASGQYVYVYF